MYHLSVIYGRPNDPAAFDEHYQNVHIPLAVKLKGITAYNLTKVGNQDGPLETQAYLIADLYAESEEAMMAALGSPEGQAAAGDVPNFATGGATFVFGDETAVPLS